MFRVAYVEESTKPAWFTLGGLLYVWKTPHVAQQRHIYALKSVGSYSIIRTKRQQQWVGGETALKYALLIEIGPISARHTRSQRNTHLRSKQALCREVAAAICGRSCANI